RGPGKWHGMLQVHGLAFGPCAVFVNENDFACDALHQKRICKSGANVSGAGDCDLCRLYEVHKKSPLVQRRMRPRWPESLKGTRLILPSMAGTMLSCEAQLAHSQKYSTRDL